MNEYTNPEMLSGLILTRDETYSFYKIQLSRLNEKEQNSYNVFLKDVLTKNNIDLILKEYFGNSFNNVELIKESFVIAHSLTEVAIYEENEKFINNKRDALEAIADELSLTLQQVDNTIATSPSTFDAEPEDSCPASKNAVIALPAFIGFELNREKVKDVDVFIDLLYEGLKDKGFIAKETIPEYFKLLFSGRAVFKPMEIYWLTGNARQILYLFDILAGKKILSLPGYYYKTLEHVFANMKGRHFKGLSRIADKMKSTKKTLRQDEIDNIIADSLK